MDILESLGDAPPKSSAFPASLHEPFPARKLRSASVVWLNERYFIEQSIDVFEPVVRASLERELVEGFGYGVPAEGEPMEGYLDERSTFQADRYGGDGVSTHAGSGRVGIRNHFQVKGIGVTPLVGIDAGYLHSHGMLTLEEAIREAIFGEVASREMPWGAIPVVAVLATGTRTPWGERRALVVRPNFFRASWLERAYDHRPVWADPLAHLHDVRRVRDMIQLLSGDGLGRDTRLGVKVTWIGQFIDRSLAQLAHIHANRIHFGVFSSSNLSINGEILDYGAARSLPNWERVIDAAPAFGWDDLVVFKECCEQLLFYLCKYGDDSVRADLDESVEAYIDRRYTQYLDRELLGLVGLDTATCPADTADRVITALRKYFAHQQRVTPALLSAMREAPAGWIQSFFTGESLAWEESFDRRVAAEVRHALSGDLGTSDDSLRSEFCLRVAQMKLAPRPSLFREDLTQQIFAGIEQHHGQVTSHDEIARRTESLIWLAVADSLRSFPWVPSDIAIAGSLIRPDSAAVYGCTASGDVQMCIRGFSSNGVIRAFSATLPWSTGEVPGYVHAVVPLERSYRGGAVSVEAFGGTLVVPAMDRLY